MKKFIYFLCLYWLFAILLFVSYNYYMFNKNYKTAEKAFTLLVPNLGRLACYQTQYDNQSLSGLTAYKAMLTAQTNSYPNATDLKEFIQSLNSGKNRPENFSLAYLDLTTLSKNFDTLIQEQASLSFDNELMSHLNIVTNVNIDGPYLTTWDGKVKKLYGDRFTEFHNRAYASLTGTTDTSKYNSIFNYQEYTVIYVVTFNVKIKLTDHYIKLNGVSMINEDIEYDVYTYTLPYMLFN